MSTPIANLRKTNLASEKIIKNGLEFRSKRPKTIEAEVYYVRRNSAELTDKENMFLNMSSRMANLENEMMGVRQDLSRAIEVINRKDAEIANLKNQLFQQINEPVQSSIPVAGKRYNKIYEEYNDAYIENSDRGYYQRPNIERPDHFYQRPYIENRDQGYSQGSNIDWKQKYYDLSNRVAEMEKFLADYGLIWVGDKKSADELDGIIQTSVDFVPDLDKVIAIIGELNERTSLESHIKIIGNEARFQKADILNITFYGDGMELENNPFRKYSTEFSLAFFQDLEDGYYPTELKESYPEGVIFKVIDKRSKPYGVRMKEESEFSGPGHRLGTEVLTGGESNQAQIYFQFDMDAKKQTLQRSILKKKVTKENVFDMDSNKQTLHKSILKKKTFKENAFNMESKKWALCKSILKKKSFRENVFPASLKQDNVQNSFDSNESRHDGHGLDNLPDNVGIKKGGSKRSMVNESSCKPILKGNIGSKDKLIQNKRKKKNVVFEKIIDNPESTSGRYNVPVESQSSPVLHRNLEEQYYPTSHPQQSRPDQQQEYREYTNKRKGREMNYDTVSRDSADDSNIVGTIYDDSYNSDDYKKNIYDATAELARRRSKLLQNKDMFVTDEQFEHMIILGKKKERDDGNFDDPNAVKNQSKGKEFKSKSPPDSEYDAYSRNMGEIRESISSRASLKSLNKDPDDLQKTFNNNKIKGKELRNETKGKNDQKSPISFSDEEITKEFKSKSPPDSEYDAYSRNMGEIRESISSRASLKSLNKDPNDFQKTFNNNIIKRKELRNETKGKNDQKSRISFSEEQITKEFKSKSPPDSEYDAYSRNMEEIRESINSRASLKSINKDPDDFQKTLNNNITKRKELRNETKGKKDRLSFTEGQAERPNVLPSSDKTSYGQAKTNRKPDNASQEDEIGEDPSSMDTEYERRYSHNIDDIALSFENRHSHMSQTSQNLHDDKAKMAPKKFKGNNTPNVAKQPPEGKVTTKNKGVRNMTPDKSKPYVESNSDNEDQESGGTNFTKPVREHDAHSKSISATSDEPYDLKPGVTDSDDDVKKFSNKFQEKGEEIEKQLKTRSDSNADKQLLEVKIFKQNIISSNNNTPEKEGKSNATDDEIERQDSEDTMSMTTEYDKAYNIGDTAAEFRRNSDASDYKFSEKTGPKKKIPSNKRSSAGGTEDEDSDTDSLMTTEYGDAYGSEIEENNLMGDRSRHRNKDKTKPIGEGQIHIINSNKESEDFVLGNEKSTSPLTTEYREAYGGKVEYAIHQCTSTAPGQDSLHTNYRSNKSNFVKPSSKKKVHEPKKIHLNNKTSDGQIELNMKSYNGKEIYSAYLYPDDPISKVWSLTKLNCEEFVVTVDDKILHMNVPLKNYNINGDVTLNISKRKPNFSMKEVTAHKPKSYSYDNAHYSGDEDYFCHKVCNEEGYSS
ncbi:myosin-2 heavy chain isoform X3 [Halyomorpha halys]|uniref:myosin-2 heavy chain isoform X3 n=1 Tax=Halyomorpha halys TaxID=286706 RepID=UPI0034D33B39